MFYLQPTFWLLVAFLLFIALIFKTAKKLILSSISKYRESIISELDSMEQKVEHSKKELANLKKQTAEIQEICQKIINSAISEAEKTETEGRKEIELYLAFKEKYIEEKTKIFTRQKIHSIKSLVLEKSINLVSAYLIKNSKNKEIDLSEMKAILKQ